LPEGLSAGLDAIRARHVALVEKPPGSATTSASFGAATVAIAHQQPSSSAALALMLCKGLRARWASRSALSRWTTSLSDDFAR
jgi:hypothetical protein